MNFKIKQYTKPIQGKQIEWISSKKKFVSIPSVVNIPVNIWSLQIYEQKNMILK